MSNTNFSRVRLGDVCELHYGKALQAEKRLGGDVPVFSSAGITGYHNEALADSEGIIVGRKGTIGTVYYSPQPFFCIDTAYYILPNDKYDMQYLYYALKTLSLDTLNEDSAVPGLNRNTAYSQIIPLPPLPVQRSIAATLSCLDRKIELNRRVNANMEAQAQTLFGNYFSQRHKDTKGWREGMLSDLVNIKYGKAHQALKDGNVPVYGSGGLMRYAEKAIYENESVLIPRKGTLNNVMYVNEPFWTVDTMFYSETKIPHSAIFVYQFLKTKDLASMNAGTAVPSMTIEILNKLPVVIPPEERLLEFDEVSSVLYNAIKQNDKQSRILAAIRDTLLPPLMSGEIEVEEARR